MPRIRQRHSGDYPLTVDVRDDDDADLTVTPGTVEVYDGTETLISTGDATPEGTDLRYDLAVADAPIGAYRADWQGSIGGVVQEWHTYFEIVPDYWPVFADYTGRLKEARFDELLTDAIAQVDSAIWPNAVTIARVGAYQRAVCAVIDVLDEPAVTSERVGNAAVTYADPRTIAAVIRQHLTGSGLMNRAL